MEVEDGSSRAPRVGGCCGGDEIGNAAASWARGGRGRGRGVMARERKGDRKTPPRSFNHLLPPMSLSLSLSFFLSFSFSSSRRWNILCVCA